MDTLNEAIEIYWAMRANGCTHNEAVFRASYKLESADVLRSALA